MSAQAPPACVTLVVAVADNGVIGRHGALPWQLPDDLKFFKSVTLGKPVLMGRRTFESIGRPLSGRRNLVLSRHPSAGLEGVEGVASLEAALELTRGVSELCVIGGAEVYALALPSARRIHLTRVHADVRGDIVFPQWPLVGWTLVDSQQHPADARHAYAMSFERWERTVDSPL